MEITYREFPGGPVLRTLCFHCKGPRFHPAWELGSHMLHGMAKRKNTYTDKKTCISASAMYSCL